MPTCPESDPSNMMLSQRLSNSVSIITSMQILLTDSSPFVNNLSFLLQVIFASFVSFTLICIHDCCFFPKCPAISETCQYIPCAGVITRLPWRLHSQRPTWSATEPPPSTSFDSWLCRSHAFRCHTFPVLGIDPCVEQPVL